MEQAVSANESRIVQQLSKPEAQLSPQQLANSEVVQKTIKRYQGKIAEMLKLIQKQRKQNQTLKNQLKQLNQNLNVMIQKINLKNQKKQQTPKQDTVKKQLENQIKRNVVMKKQLDVLRAKVKIYQGQKITDLQDQIRQKDKIIEEQNNTIKMYTKLEKQESNIDIYKKYNEANEKINSLNGELIHLKKKLTEAKKVEDQQEKNIKRQHQQLLSIQKKDVDRKEKSVSAFGKKQDLKQENSVGSIQAIKLKQKLQALQNAKKMSQKALRVEIDNLKSKNKALQKQLQQFKSQITRKDKETNILMSKMKQITRKSHQTLQPVQKITYKSQDIVATSGLFDHRKQFKGLMHLQNNSTKFDDTEQLPFEKAYKIKSIKFTWFEQHILSLVTVYEFSDSSTKQIKTFQIPHQYKNTKQQELSFNDFQYIKEMEIYCSRFIEFIRIRTSRDHMIQIGTQKNQAKCKKFTYDIKTNEKPIAFMGAIQSKKLGGNQANGTNKEHLISLGLEIKKKDAFTTKNRFQPSANQLKSQNLLKKVQKVASKVGIIQKQQNDKNMIVESQQK